MLVNTEYNDQNIDRAFTKMSDNFTGQNSNTNFSNKEQNVNFLQCGKDGEASDDLNPGYDHLYASNNSENGLSTISEDNCQNAESEVRFLKEWLLIHLDLIQQQNDDILSKEKTIYLLKKENELLKEKIGCLESGSPYQNNKKHTNNHKSPEYKQIQVEEEMTQGPDPGQEDNNLRLPKDLEEVQTICDTSIVKCEAKSESESDYLNINETSIEFSLTDIKIEETDIKDTILLDSVSASENLESDINILKLGNSSAEESAADPDPMKNIRIRRNRLCSSSSNVSQNDGSIEDKRSSQRTRKKRKRCIKDEDILTTEELYHTQAGDMQLIPPTDQELAAEMALMVSNALEVPKWRVKVYASCYSMEGTENLEDAVFNRRHSRLEINERRRKRWDVQRIREQRIIEKLKQRQERSSRTSESSEPIQSLWPALEDIKYIEITDKLPVSAFGSPLVNLPPSEFSLPWLDSDSQPAKKAKKSRRSRKGTKR